MSLTLSPLNRRVLIVDDNPAIHEDFKKILAATDQPSNLAEAEAILFGHDPKAVEKIHFETDSAYQGQEAFEKVRAAQAAGQPYAMAFVDMRMPPGWNGLETIQHLWEADSDLQIVICTAFSDFSWEEITHELGNSDNVLILKKPFDNIEVLQFAHALTTKWRLARQARLKVEELEAIVRERTRELVEANDSLQKEMAERQRAQAERLQIERKLQQAQKLESLGVVAAGVAHDFNNLLTGVMGNASLGRMELPDTSPVQEYLEQIEKASRQASSLCKQMLAYSGRGHFIMQTLDLTTLVEDCTHLLQISVSKKAVLRFDLARHLPKVQVDATQIRQVLMNLVINASEAIGGSSGLIRIVSGVMRASRSYLEETYPAVDLPEGDYVYLEVSDNGCGMSPETKSKIFDPFFTTKFTGRGLGLAAVLGIMRGHKGALKVDTEVGRGTIFRLLLPCAEGPVTEPKPTRTCDPSWRGHGHVLIVDDEDTVRAVTARMLEAIGFKVSLAANGREGLTHLESNGGGVDAVLLDLTMPVLSGEEAFAEIHHRWPKLPVLLMSGFSEKDAHERFDGKGLAGFLQKPFNTDGLRAKLQEAFQPPTAALAN